MAKRGSASKKKKSGDGPHDTPAMRQFRQFKQQHPDCVLFFRMGDFYEMFYDDAKLANKVLGVTLTQRTQGIPMAGVPYHAVEGYLRRMIQAGYRVAVCDQVQDPKEAKGVVDRDVTRVVTPGTLTDDALLDEARSNTVAAVQFLEESQVAVAWAELSTGDFSIALFDEADVGDELVRIGPSELVYVETANLAPPERVKQLIDLLSVIASPRPAWQFRLAEAAETLRHQYGVAQLSGFGLSDDDPVVGPAGALVRYLLDTYKHTDGTQPKRIAHLQPPRRFDRDQHLVIDQTSLRSLEVERTLRSGSVEGSLLGIFQRGKHAPATGMGKRLLRDWLSYPLCERKAIEARHDAVSLLLADGRVAGEIHERLGEVQDVARIAGRLAMGRALPRDVVALGGSLSQVKALADATAEAPALQGWHDALSALAEPLGALAEVIEKQCVEEPPAHLREGGLFRDGVDAQLDEARTLQTDSHSWLAKYQKELIEQTQIPSLKVGYNKVFGYYIEVTAAHRDKAPDAWSRKQTLKNAERYVTPELKEFEGKVLSAEQRAVDREQQLFRDLCDKACGQLEAMRQYSLAVAELDVLGAFARLAGHRQWCRPELVDEAVLRVNAGRHPVLEQLLLEQFVPNDVQLRAVGDDESSRDGDENEQQSPRGESGIGADDEVDQVPRETGSLALITGPNMAGKSTFIRQNALLVLLAQAGAFVPAERMVMGLCDRIFTRVGASDELHAGQSTFMVEMLETANICHHATPRSLVILDEIGRGTSTLDGLSLAWAIAEHLAQLGCRTLFATHYHEITQLADQYPQVRNLHVTVREWQEEIVFLHRLAEGATDRSYGIHVAKIAGLPKTVIDRAGALLAELSVSQQSAHLAEAQPGKAKSKAKADANQLSLFTEYVEHPAITRLRETEIESLSPMQAFDLLRQVCGELDGK